MKVIIERLKEMINSDMARRYPNSTISISIPEAQQIIQSLEQLERIWGKLATAEQDFELCLEENKRLKELLTEIVHRLVK